MKITFSLNILKNLEQVLMSVFTSEKSDIFDSNFFHAVESSPKNPSKIWFVMCKTYV